MNNIGTLILNGILKGENKKEITSKILKTYDVDKYSSSKDFEEFVEELEQSGIIKKIKNKTNKKTKNDRYGV
ncbi:MAG: PqqD family protein [Candidatus Micrarchaeia archaeon]